jgi:hypothetical protein
LGRYYFSVDYAVNAFVVSGLVKRRAQLAGDIEKAYEASHQMNGAAYVPRCCLHLLTERALNREDQKLLRLMTKRVGVALRGQREQGVAKADQGPGQYMLWEIAK